MSWIPSHGKKADWTPPDGWPPTARCRAANEEADKAATAQLQRLVGWWTRLRRDIADAEDWSWRALRTQLDATNEWHESLKQAMQRRNELRRFAGRPALL